MLTEALDQCCREVAAQNAFQVGVVREVGLLQCVGEVNLHVRSQDGQLGAGQAVAGGLQTLVQLLVGGQELDGAVQAGVLFQVVHEALVQVGAQEGTVELTLQQNVLLNVGLEDLAADLVLQGLDEGSTLFAGQLAVCHEAVHQNLDVDLTVTGFHTCGVVDCVGVEDNAVERSLNTTSWVKPRLPPSPTILARRSLPLTRSASLALSPTCALSRWMPSRRYRYRRCKSGRPVP